MNTGLTNTHVSSIAVSDSIIFVGTSGGVFFSKNNGLSWITMKPELTDTVVSSLALYDTNLCVGTLTGGVFLSTNRGTNWKMINLPINYIVHSIALTKGKLFIGTNNGLFRSTNNAGNWSAVTQFLSSHSVTSLIVNDTLVIAGTNGGSVYISTNSGENWKVDNKGLMPYYLSSIHISSISIIDTNIFVGTEYDGIYRRPISQLTISSVQQKPVTSLQQFILKQNYPNPFNPSTKISFDLPAKSFVTLKVFDLIGRDVATIVSEEMVAGSFTRQWNAANVSSGIYFYRLQAGSFSEIKKLILLR